MATYSTGYSGRDGRLEDQTWGLLEQGYVEERFLHEAEKRIVEMSSGSSYANISRGKEARVTDWSGFAYFMLHKYVDLYGLSFAYLINRELCSSEWVKIHAYIARKHTALNGLSFTHSKESHSTEWVKFHT